MTFKKKLKKVLFDFDLLGRNKPVYASIIFGLIIAVLFAILRASNDTILLSSLVAYFGYMGHLDRNKAEWVNL